LIIEIKSKTVSRNTTIADNGVGVQLAPEGTVEVMDESIDGILSDNNSDKDDDNEYDIDNMNSSF